MRLEDPKVKTQEEESFNQISGGWSWCRFYCSAQTRAATKFTVQHKKFMKCAIRVRKKNPG